VSLELAPIGLDQVLEGALVTPLGGCEQLLLVLGIFG
jgi:hypothetical protein